MSRLLFETGEWSFDTLRRTHDAIEAIAVGEMGLDTYPNQIELISSEQMLDTYSSVGMPIFYGHWSFGKRFMRDEVMYRKGYSGLAYEIVINSNPCISYIMEENTMTMQALVMAHAAFGHNHFFKNNYLFREQTDASGILDYLSFAKAYIASCEERYGLEAVERVLDAAHALMDQGVDRYGRHARPSLAEERARLETRQRHAQAQYNDLWRTVPAGRDRSADVVEVAEFRRAAPRLPEENLLYFLEKFSPSLRGWEREVLRIVRNVAQYFFPQRQTKVMNEGCATYVHYKIMHRLHELGQIGDGAMLEFLASHTAVVRQPDFDDRFFSGINPYALGFEMMCDIERIATDPTDEDRAYFPDLAGSGDGLGALKHAWANYRDDSFIAQFLSPRLMRKMRLFKLENRAGADHYRVAAIHEERGYTEIRRALASQYDPGGHTPNIQVTSANLAGDRKLTLTHRLHNEMPLATDEAKAVLGYIADLWGFDVQLRGVGHDDQFRYSFESGSAPKPASTSPAGAALAAYPV
jgi:spore cortex formation protein SpoVR/YcgB (stage V sporulation)